MYTPPICSIYVYVYIYLLYVAYMYKYIYTPPICSMHIYTSYIITIQLPAAKPATVPAQHISM